MKKMNIPLMATLLALSLVVCPILYFNMGPTLDARQLAALKLLGMIAGCSAFFCFALGEITRNNSQVDKIWSLLPIRHLTTDCCGSCSTCFSSASIKMPLYSC